MVSHLRTQILTCFIYFLWSYLVAVCEFSCLAKLAKPYPASGPTYLLQAPHQLHCIPHCAPEVLLTVYWAKLMPASILKSFAYERLRLCI